MATTATAHLQRYSGAPVGSCCFRTTAPALSIPRTLLRNLCYGQPIGPRHGVGGVLLGVPRSYASDLADLLHLSVVQVDSQAVIGLLGLLVVAATTPLLYAQAQQANDNQLGLAGDGAPWGGADPAAPAAAAPAPPAATKAAAAVSSGTQTAATKPAASSAGAAPAPASPRRTPAAAASTGPAPAAAPGRDTPGLTPSGHPAAPSTSPASTPTAAAAPLAGAPWGTSLPSLRLLAAPTSSSQAQHLLADHAGSQPRRAAPSLLAPPAKRLSLPAQATPRASATNANSSSSSSSSGGGGSSSHGTTGGSTGQAPTAATAAVATQAAAPLGVAPAPRKAPPAGVDAAGPHQQQQEEEEDEDEGQAQELDSLALAAALVAASDAGSSRDRSPPPSVITSLDEAADALLLPQEAQVGPGELSLAVGLLRAAGQDEEVSIGPAAGHTLTQRLHQLLVLLDVRPGAGREAATRSHSSSTGQTTTSSSSSSVMDSFWGEEDDWEDVRAALMAVGIDQSLEEEDSSGSISSGAGAAAFLDAGSVQRLGEVLQELRARQGLPAAPPSSGALGVAGEGGEEVGGVAESSEEAAWWEAVGVAYQAVWEEARLVRQQAG